MEIADPQWRNKLAEPLSLRRSRDILLDPSRPAWSHARIVVFDIPLASGAYDTWLPAPLKPAAVPAATAFVADYPSTSFGIAYRESGILVHARLRGRPVLHCAWMVVDDDTAMILGRELLGFPKKLARIEMAAADGMLHAAVTRRGTTLLRLEGRVDKPLPAARAFAHPIANVRGNPGFFPAVLWRMEVPERFHQGAKAELEVAVTGSVYDPLQRMIAGGRFEGRLLDVDLGVPPSEPKPFPSGIYPAGLVSPLWLARMYPFRTM